MAKYIFVITGFFLISLNLLAQDDGTEPVEEEVGDIWYVTDRLRLSLYKKSNAKSGSTQQLNSGDKLSVLQISGNYALVITPDGSRGWVKRGFLVPEPTSTLLLAQELIKTGQLSEELEKLANSKMVIDQYETDMDALTERIQTLKNENDQSHRMITELQQAAQEKAEMEAALAAAESEGALPFEVLKMTAISYWQYLIPIAMLFILAGFLMGKLVVESRIRKRFSGIKVW
jgi:SH3 domain protein